MLRRLLFTDGVPASVDSGFLYSLLPFFDQHDVGSFSGWLSWPFGQVQHFSIYWLLAPVESLVGDPVVVYKLAVLVTVLLASCGAYGLAYWLTSSRLSASVAAGLYVLAPFSVSALLAGHLDVAISYAVGPFALWSLWAALRNGSRAAMVGFGLCGSALYLVTTGQGAYWVLPALGVLVAEVVRARQRGAAVRPIAGRIWHVTRVAMVVFLAASAVQILPLLAGINAPFVRGNTHYYVQELATHARYSSSFFDSMLGVPREVWTTPEITIAAGPFTGFFYRVVALALVLIALSALFTRHVRASAVLLLPTVFAWMLASGPEGPIRPLYLFFYNHVPYFSLLRAPNRWLMVSTLGISMLVAMAIGGFLGRHRASTLFGRRRDLGSRLAIVAVWLGLFSGSYALFHGIPTWEPPSSYAQAYSQLRSDKADWRILTTPYFQTWMRSGTEYGSDLTFAADLGHTSTQWHGNATLDRGGWDPRASRFARYLSELTEQGTSRRLTKLLGAVGVKYIGLNPHRAWEVPSWQNPFFRRQEGLRPFTKSGRIAIYRNAFALPQAFLARQECLVVGGLGVLGDLAEQPSFSFSRVALRFADQVAAVGGRDDLTAAVASSSCMIMASGGERALTALLYAADSRALAPFAPNDWITGETSPSRDIAADPSLMVSIPSGERLEGAVSAPEAGRYSLWVAGLRTVDQGRVSVAVDGKTVGSVDLDAAAGAGIRWTPNDPVSLSKGRHSFALHNVAKDDKRDATLTKVALVPASASVKSTLASAHVIRERGGAGPITQSSQAVGPSLLKSHWNTDQASDFVTATTQHSSLDVRVVRSGRRYFTIASGRARGAVNPYRPLAIRFRGTGSGQTFYLNVLFDRRGERLVWFRFVDETREERTLLFSPLQPSGVSTVPDWSNVKGFSISTNSKIRWPETASIDGPYQLSGTTPRPSFVAADGSDPFSSAPPGMSALDPPTQKVNDHAKLGDGLGRGTLVFTQSYHPDWKLKAKSGHARHTVALGFANAYSVDKPLEGASLSFTAAKYGKVGTWISLFAWLMCLGIVVRWLSRERLQGKAESQGKRIG
jgi:hypothetical protein